MLSSVVSLLLTTVSFQAPALAEAPLEPLRSPQEIADQNPTLTNEMRGDIMMARKMFREAVDFYKREANDSPVMANKTGMAYHQLGDLDNAKRYYDRAIRLNGEYADAINNRGTIHYARKSFREASRDYEKALEIDPNSAAFWLNLGTSYFARKQYEEAYISLANSLILDPNVLDTHGTAGSRVQDRTVEEKARFYYMLAKAYSQAGLTEQAIRYVRFAMENEFQDAELFLEEEEFALLAAEPEFLSIMAPLLPPPTEEQSSL